MLFRSVGTILTHTTTYIFRSIGFIFGCLQQHTNMSKGGSLGTLKVGMEGPLSQKELLTSQIPKPTLNTRLSHSRSNIMSSQQPSNIDCVAYLTLGDEIKRSIDSSPLRQKQLWKYCKRTKHMPWDISSWKGPHTVVAWSRCTHTSTKSKSANNPQGS